MSPSRETRMRPIKLLALWLLASCVGCASFNRAFDANVTPPQDTKWMITGAVFDATLQVTKVKPVIRLAADATAAGLIRLTPWFGKNLDSGVDFMFTVGVSEVIGLVIRKHP